jgi:hypothetical protein
MTRLNMIAVVSTATLASAGIGSAQRFIPAPNGELSRSRRGLGTDEAWNRGTSQRYHKQKARRVSAPASC